VWCTQTYRCTATLSGHKGAVFALLLAPRHLFSASSDSTKFFLRVPLMISSE
jgi:hypothetical protein